MLMGNFLSGSVGSTVNWGVVCWLQEEPITIAEVRITDAKRQFDAKLPRAKFQCVFTISFNDAQIMSDATVLGKIARFPSCDSGSTNHSNERFADIYAA